MIDSIDKLSGVATPAVANDLKQDTYLSGFAVRNVEIVGPQVGAQLRKQALLATLYSLAGMLIYLWFRFELIYGVAAVVAVFHDTIITVGACVFARVIVGIGQYADKHIKARKHAEDDAQALYDLFTDKQYLGADPKNVRLLLGRPDDKRHGEQGRCQGPGRLTRIPENRMCRRALARSRPLCRHTWG